MATETVSISKEEYLKRYLSSPDDSSKKKNKLGSISKKSSRGFKIVDHDAKVSTGNASDEDERGAEYKPQIEVIDDRPLAARKDETQAKTKWLPMADDSISKKHEQRRRRHDSDADSDQLPSRSRTSSSRVERDLSPPRRTKRHDSDSSPPRKRHDSDTSPPRKRKNSDSSPPRKRQDTDSSPPRKRKNSDSDSRPTRKRHDSDSSPPRKRHDSDTSPPRRSHLSKNNDLSPPRQRQRMDSDASPPRRRESVGGRNDDLSPRRRQRENSPKDSSSFRRNQEPSASKSVVKVEKGLPSKTLSGATAGLQSADKLKIEMKMLRQRDEEAFEKIANEVSGRGAETVFRSSGRKAEERKKKEQSEETKKKQQELESKYKEWNRGVKQVREQGEIVKEHIHEMDKPMARYADDQDMNEYLRGKDYEKEDPMFKYIKKKKHKQSGPRVVYPSYQGPAPPPNRFGISPGYRWDGVDRSNGFESKLLSRENAQMATAEERYKYEYSHDI